MNIQYKPTDKIFYLRRNNMTQSRTKRTTSPLTLYATDKSELDQQIAIERAQHIMSELADTSFLLMPVDTNILFQVNKFNFKQQIVIYDGYLNFHYIPVNIEKFYELSDVKLIQAVKRLYKESINKDI